ncbi:O-antigen polysaccharide polymerase Wzy [Enterococcus casseliflavus]|uniref:O-antigen polysaccharide polymerase Wzy n=1 Tax=Enterococcus casseliflavus TaxID=37734 RepID=UPI003D144F6A
MKLKRYIGFQLILTLLTILVAILLNEYLAIDNRESLYILCLYNVISFFLHLAILCLRTKYIFHPISLFSIFFYLFSSGQLILYVFGIQSTRFNVFERVDLTSLSTSILFVTLAYSFYQLGVVLAYSKNTLDFEQSITFNLEKDSTMYNVGLILLTIGIVPFTIQLVNNLQVVLSSGYKAYYESGARVDSVFMGLIYYFYVGIIFLACSNINENKSKLYSFIFVVISIIRFLSGDRGDGILLLLSSLLLYLFLVKKKKFNLKQIVLLFLLVPFLVPLVDIWRNSVGNNNEGNFFEMFILTLKDSNAYVLMLENLGATIYPLGKLVSIFPYNVNFLYGITYISSLVLLIPSPLRIGFIGDLTNNQLFSSPANWLQKYLDLSYGQGFSPFAEAYMNFGFWGIPFMFFFGYIVVKAFSPNIKKLNVNMKLGIMVSVFLLFSMSTRGSSNFMIAFYVRYILIPIVIYLLYKGRKKFEKNINRHK